MYLLLSLAFAASPADPVVEIQYPEPKGTMPANGALIIAIEEDAWLKLFDAEQNAVPYATFCPAPEACAARPTTALTPGETYGILGGPTPVGQLFTAEAETTFATPPKPEITSITTAVPDTGSFTGMVYTFTVTAPAGSATPGIVVIEADNGEVVAGTMTGDTRTLTAEISEASETDWDGLCFRARSYANNTLMSGYSAVVCDEFREAVVDDTDPADTDSEDDPSDDPDEATGCGCSSTPPSGLWTLLALPLLVGRRRSVRT